MRIFIIILLSIAFVGTRYYLTLPKYKIGVKIRISSVVLTQPINYEKSQYFKLRGLKVYLPLYPSISYGDRIVVEGVVDKDTLKNPQLINIRENGNPIYKIRENLLEVYEKSLPPDEAALVAGVTIGSKSGIGNEFWQKLKKSGTAHVVVASGMNITLVGAFLMSMTVSYFKRRRAIFMVVGGIWIYTLLCGFEAPVVRAALMGTIAFVAQATGRLNDTLRAVIISAYLMLVLYPQWIVDIGFILSFSATLSLIFFSRPVTKFTKKLRIIKSLPKVFKEAFDTTISAQIAVIPIIFLTFGSFNPFSIVANTLTLWTIPAITVFGFIGGLVGLFYLPAGTSLLLIGYPLVRYFTFVVELFSWG